VGKSNSPLEASPQGGGNGRSGFLSLNGYHINIEVSLNGEMRVTGKKGEFLFG